MNIFGIGPTEILFILLLALIIFGPKDLQKAGKTIGQGLRKLANSDTWKVVTQTSTKLKDLPNELMRQAGADEVKDALAPLQADIQQANQAVQKSAAAWQGESWEAAPDDKGDSPIQLKGSPTPAPSPRNDPGD